MLNSLITECIDHLAQLGRVQVTGAYAPLGIRALQAERNQLNPKAHDDNNKGLPLLKKSLPLLKKRRKILCRAVSPKRPKEVWKVINLCSIKVADHCEWTQINGISTLPSL